MANPFTDRLRRLLSITGDTLKRVAGSMADGAGTSPPVDLPGLPHWTSNRSNLNRQLRQALGLEDAYLGRLSYDAGPSWTRFSSNPATDLTPEKIVGAQQEAIAGYPLRFEEMIEQVLSRDTHLSGIAQQRVDDVVKGPWRLTRSTNDDIAAAVRSFCDEAVRNVEDLEDAFAWLLWANGYCYNSTETVWKEDRVTFPGPKGEILGPINVLVPQRLDAVHAKHFQFDLRTDEPLLWLGSDQVSLPFGKFVFNRGEGQNPITERRGYMWPCIWPSMFKSIGISGWATYVDRFALPTPLLEYGDLAQYEEHKQVFRDILKNLGQGIGAVIPSDVKVTPFQPAQGGRAQDPHSAFSDACDAWQSVRILGATLTAKIGNVGSFAASSTHAEVKYAKEEADARRLWSTLRRDLLTPLVMFNAEAIANALRMEGYQVTPDMVMRRVPRGMHRVPREMSPGDRMNIVKTAVNELGMEVGMEDLYDEFNLPQPKNPKDRAPGKPMPISSGGIAVGAVEAATEGAEAPAPNQQRALPTHNGEPNDA